MASASEAVNRLRFEVTTTGAEQSAAQLGRVAVGHDAVATAAATAGRSMAGYEAQMAAIQKRQEAYTAALVANTAALTNSSGAMVAANDNAAKSFAGASIEAASLANHVKLVGEAAYAFSPAFRGVVNGLAAPALRGASVALVAVAGGIVTATNLAGSGMVRLGAAAASASPSLSPIAAGLTSAGVALQAFNPSIAGVATSILSKFLPALRLLGTVGLIVNAAKMVGDAWELGGQQLERYRQIAEDAAKVDLSTTYFQKLTKGAEAAKLPVDALTAALTTLQKQSADQLGGSALGNRLSASVKVGNFAGNTGVQEFAQANTTQQRYEAIVSLIHQAMEAGQRLAALDIAGTAFGPEAADNLRKDSEYFDKLTIAAAKISDAQLVSPEDVGRALDLQTRYDAAVKILETRWHPIQDLLTQAGVEFHANWVATVETIAQAFDWTAKMVAKLGDVPSWFQKKLNEGGQWIIDNTTTPESRKAAETSYGISSDSADMAKGTDAYAVAVNKLRAGLQDHAEQQRKVSEANTIAQKTLGDTSHQIDNLKKKTEEAADAYDRALEGVTKHTARMQADTLAVGLGAGALEEYRARAQLTTAAQLAGRDPTAALTAEIEKQAKAAGEAGRALALAKAQSQANFTGQTQFMSSSDLAAAQVMHNLYGDEWQSHMDDALAKQIKMNSLLGTAKDYADTFGQSLVQAFASGKSGSEALSSAISAIGSKLSSDLMSKATTNIMSGDPSQMAQGGVQAASALAISWLQGEAAKAKKAEADFKAAQDAWAAMAGEVTKFKDQMLGQNTGSLGAAITDATTKAQSYADAAHKAGQATGDLTSVLATYIQRVTRDFINTFDTTIEALSQGLGMDSPAVKAAANVKSIGDTLKGFIDDTVKAGQGLGQAAPAIAAATTASQSYALSLLQTPPVLTTVQTALLTLRGNAQQLQTTLQDLGMSADDAGTAISAGIKKALATISSNFTQGLQEQINSASGKDYINQINALLKTGASNLSDAQSLGLDPALVAQAFQAQAQQVVDSAGLVGSAFDDFIKQFPQLSGVVNQSATAIKSLSDATTQFYATLRTTISNYLHNLNTGTQSALSPQDRLATAQSDYNKQLAMAQGGNRDAISSITQYSNDLLSAAKDDFASSAGYADILKQVQSQLASLPDMAAANDPVVEQLKQVTANTGNTVANTASTVATLSALSAIQAATQSSSVNISASVTQLGAQGAYVAAAQGSQYFGPMNGYLSQIAANTLLSGQAASDPGSGSVWWNPFTWFADGGVVTGGTPGRDSVMAMLTPNEFVVKPGPAEAYMPLLEAMNAGMLPPLRHFAEGGPVMAQPMPQITMMRSGGWANDNPAPASGGDSQHFNALANTLVRAMAGISMTEITAMREENAALRAAVDKLTRAVEANKPKDAPKGTRAYGT